MSDLGARIATIGTFDGVHKGHQSVLEDLNLRSRACGMEPLVVTFDRHPLELVAPERAPKMLMSSTERYEKLRQLVPNVAVIEFDEAVRRLTAVEFMSMLCAEYGVEALLLGFNHRFGSDGLQRFEQFAAQAEGIGMAVFQAVEAQSDGDKISSTIIRHALTRGDVSMAARYLTRPYRIVGRVTSGKQLGRKIGFPTANIEPDEPRQLVPKIGVYACVATCSDGRQYKAMVNIGVRPTVDVSGKPTIEAHLMDFAGDLYGSTVALDFVARIRDEKQFASLDDLIAELHHDKIKTETILAPAF